MDDPMNSLTYRERRVLQLREAGQDTRQIAEQLHMSPNTVRIYVQRINLKLGAQR
jgi:DNA-binding CsgD family transcriptional regulator